MPIYEYECNKCHRRTNILTLRVSEKADVKCSHCGSHELSRLMSRFAITRSDEQRMEAMADPSNFSDLDENDPKSVARLMKKMGQEMGEEFSGEDFDQAMEEMERGEGGGDDDLGGSDL